MMHTVERRNDAQDLHDPKPQNAFIKTLTWNALGIISPYSWHQPLLSLFLSLCVFKWSFPEFSATVFSGYLKVPGLHPSPSLRCSSTVSALSPQVRQSLHSCV